MRPPLARPWASRASSQFLHPASRRTEHWGATRCCGDIPRPVGGASLPGALQPLTLTPNSKPKLVSSIPYRVDLNYRSREFELRETLRII